MPTISDPQCSPAFETHGIDTNGVAVDADNTSGIAMILLDSGRQNHVIQIHGANAACDQTQLRASVEAMKDADALMLQLETPAQLSLAAAQYARSIDVKVVWDPAPALSMPDGSYQLVDVLTPNQGETEVLTGVKVTDLDSANRAADMLLGLGVSKVVVKLGEQGVYYAGQGERGHVDAFRVKAVDAIAAGDTFGAAFTVALSEGRGLGEAVRFGAAAGALAVTKSGAQEAMPFRSELEEFIGQVGV